MSIDHSFTTKNIGESFPLELKGYSWGDVDHIVVKVDGKPVEIPKALVTIHFHMKKRKETHDQEIQPVV